MIEANGASRLGIDRGIDRISRHQPEDETRLPDAALVVPGDAPLAHRLDAVLFQPSLDETMLASLRPMISDRSVLAPGKYSQLSLDAEEQLREQIESEPNEPSTAKYDRLIALLEGERELRDLFDEQRNFLRKG